MPVIDLDEPCGRYLRYRDLIWCGKTWAESEQRGAAIDNLPREAASVAALAALALAVLDPLAEEFGPPTLTYGFASRRLTTKIAARIAPSLDQHAACELRPSGGLVCPRQGAAVDLVIPGRTATEVARWIASHTPFDRIYIYGDDRPLHVSHGPEDTRMIVQMMTGPSGRLVPRRLRW